MSEQTHPFLRGPAAADRAARLLQRVSARASEIESAIAVEAREVSDPEIARRLGQLVSRWSATVGAYEDASLQLQLWASGAAAPERGGDPDDPAESALRALERLESEIVPRVAGVETDDIASTPLLDAGGGAAGPRDVRVPVADRVFSLRAAGPFPARLQDDFDRLEREYISQSRGAVSIGTRGRGTTTVTVTVRTTPPGDDPAVGPWDHVTEASILASEGLLVLEGGGRPVMRLQVPIGVWRVRVQAQGLDRPGAESHHMVLWRDRSLQDAVVVKQHRGAVSQGTPAAG